MNRVIRTVSAGLLLAAVQPLAAADPSAGQTTVLGPFTGVGAPLHPANKSPLLIKYYGTDLGWSYEHRGQLHFLFGDTAATEKGELIEASSKSVYDDGFGTIDLKEWPDPALITPQNIPLIKLGQNPGTTEMSAINPGHALESFKTPLGGFSNGRDEFGLFYASKPQACRVNDDCSSGLVCDVGLGYLGERPDTDKGLTVGCVDGTQSCNADTVFDSAGKPLAGQRLLHRSVELRLGGHRGRAHQWHGNQEPGRHSQHRGSQAVHDDPRMDHEQVFERHAAHRRRLRARARFGPRQAGLPERGRRRWQSTRLPVGAAGVRRCGRAGTDTRPLLRLRRHARRRRCPLRASLLQRHGCQGCPAIQPQRTGRRRGRSRFPPRRRSSRRTV